VRQVRVRRRPSAARVDNEPGTATPAPGRAAARRRNDALERLIAELSELLD
jgi:hypothetical protein